MSMTTILPNEVMAMVLSKLGLRDVTRAGRVCKKWGGNSLATRRS